jgi:hypothetical protein
MSKCVTTAPVVVCFTAADGTRTSLLEHVIYGKDGAAIGQAFTTAADTETLVDVSAGTITAGACPIFTPDIEWDDYCDVQVDGTFTAFVRRTITSFDANGAVIDPVQVNDFETDQVTPYVVTGTVEDECPCLVNASLGTITSWGDLA